MTKKTRQAVFTFDFPRPWLVDSGGVWYRQGNPYSGQWVLGQPNDDAAQYYGRTITDIVRFSSERKSLLLDGYRVHPDYLAVGASWWSRARTGLITVERLTDEQERRLFDEVRAIRDHDEYLICEGVALAEQAALSLAEELGGYRCRVSRDTLVRSCSQLLVVGIASDEARVAAEWVEATGRAVRWL